MKNKWYSTLIFILLVTTILAPLSHAAPAQTVSVNVEGKAITFTSLAPVRTTEGRVLVPLRALAERLGGKVTWNNTYRSVVVETADVSLEVSIDSVYVQRTHLDSSDVPVSRVAKLDAAPILINENTFIPLRAVAEFLGYTVKWNEQTKTASLTYTGLADTELSYVEYPLLGDSKQLSAPELDVFFLTNELRAKHSAPKPLGLHVELSKVAREKSKDMNDHQYFSHTSPTYGTPFEMMESFGFYYKAAGENLAMGYPTAARAIQGWEESPGHLDNILSNSFEYVGVGYYNGDSTYWTQHFFTGLP
ncbi:stalk domain-containing protein [Paenibacillus senegalensis]|uniref:stalk domain-containing protein n=1 Tax=Paenibacillus senegalensis TaxID=1465766 RepID=UPI000287C12B|nr:stalk domain-containing protein [Paenibacillus senegalensis]